MNPRVTDESAARQCRFVVPEVVDDTEVRVQRKIGPHFMSIVLIEWYGRL